MFEILYVGITERNVVHTVIKLMAFLRIEVWFIITGLKLHKYRPGGVGKLEFVGGQKGDGEIILMVVRSSRNALLETWFGEP